MSEFVEKMNSQMKYKLLRYVEVACKNGRVHNIRKENHIYSFLINSTKFEIVYFPMGGNPDYRLFVFELADAYENISFVLTKDTYDKLHSEIEKEEHRQESFKKTVYEEILDICYLCY